jgi:RES domain-containing protein
LCTKIDVASLPANWSDPVPKQETRLIGTEWARNKVSAVLAVPSAVVPVEVNYLLNPFHPDFPKIEIGQPLEFLYDPRILKTT